MAVTLNKDSKINLVLPLEVRITIMLQKQNTVD